MTALVSVFDKCMARFETCCVANGFRLLQFVCNVFGLFLVSVFIEGWT